MDPTCWILLHKSMGPGPGPWARGPGPGPALGGIFFLYKKNIPMSSILIVLCMNGVTIARHGPILEHNEATGSRKVSRYLPDLWDTI